MAVILSNAYKGENITKIISPLSPIPFREFNDLVRYNFNIYSWPTQHLDFTMTGDGVRRLEGISKVQRLLL